MIKPYGEKTNQLMSINDLLRVMTQYDKQRYDIIVPRAQIKADAVRGNGTQEDYFAFHFGEDVRTLFFPTNVVMNQIAEKTKIPTEFLKTNADRYPHLAAEMVNTWINDRDTLNLVGTARERKRKTTAEDTKHLVRLFAPNGNPGVFRALLSSRYLIIDNVDAMKTVLDEIDKAKKNDKVKLSGSLNESRMNVRIKVADISATLSYPGRGAGHKTVRVPCGASLLYQNSDVGAGGYNIIPELEIESCTNLVRATVSMRQIHIGGDVSEMSFLSAETIAKMNETVMLRARDIIRTVLNQETFDKLAVLFSEYAGEPVEAPATVIENVTKKFAIPSDKHEAIFNKFMEEAETVGGANRFALSQALTAQAVPLREQDFEASLAFEEAGSKILTMTKDEFGKFAVKN